MKKLFILTSDGGDGSRGVHFTMNEDFIAKLEAKDNAGELDYDSLGVDGDGFGYEVLTVPDECTLESLGGHYDAAVDFGDED